MSVINYFTDFFYAKNDQNHDQSNKINTNENTFTYGKKTIYLNCDMA